MFRAVSMLLLALLALGFSFTAQAQGNLQRRILLITSGYRALDGVSKPVILINGRFQPPLVFFQGDEIELNVVNQLPTSWPSVADGITIHFHGFHFKGRRRCWVHLLGAFAGRICWAHAFSIFFTGD